MQRPRKVTGPRQGLRRLTNTTATPTLRPVAIIKAPLPSSGISPLRLVVDTTEVLPNRRVATRPDRTAVLPQAKRIAVRIDLS